jgi:ankyrin repeat protein
MGIAAVVGCQEPALEQSIRSHSDEQFDYLIAHGGSTSERDHHGFTPLHLAAFFQNEYAAAKLVEKGVELDARDNEGNTPLSIAVQGGPFPGVVKVLLEHGANPNIQNGYLRQTPLCIAVQNGFDDDVSLLLDHRANPTITDRSHRTPYWMANAANREKIVAIFKSHGIDR